MTNPPDTPGPGGHAASNVVQFSTRSSRYTQAEKDDMLRNGWQKAFQPGEPEQTYNECLRLIADGELLQALCAPELDDALVHGALDLFSSSITIMRNNLSGMNRSNEDYALAAYRKFIDRLADCTLSLYDLDDLATQYFCMFDQKYFEHPDPRTIEDYAAPIWSDEEDLEVSEKIQAVIRAPRHRALIDDALADPQSKQYEVAVSILQYGLGEDVLPYRFAACTRSGGKAEPLLELLHAARSPEQLEQVRSYTREALDLDPDGDHWNSALLDNPKLTISIMRAMIDLAERRPAGDLDIALAALHVDEPSTYAIAARLLTQRPVETWPPETACILEAAIERHAPRSATHPLLLARRKLDESQ